LSRRVEPRMNSEVKVGGKHDPDPRKLIIVLEKASLETVKTKKGFELLSADSHSGILKANRKNAADYRPDILHRCLLTLLDSPLNKAGRLKIYIHTEKNIVIDINPTLRIPRTYKRFAGLMVQLLHKLKIRASDGPEVLMKCIKAPVEQHLPPGCVKIGTSTQGDLVSVSEFIPTLPSKQPIVMVFGSHAHGPADVDWTERSVAISAYPLSASCAISRTLNGFENFWDIL